MVAQRFRLGLVFLVGGLLFALNSSQKAEVGSTAPLQDPASAGSELLHFSFYVDAGHGGLGQANCQEPGTDGPAGSLEREWTLRLANTYLGPILLAHDAFVYYSRTGDYTVCNDARAFDNNDKYANYGGSVDNWRYISVHLNNSGNSSNPNRTEIYTTQTEPTPPPEGTDLANKARIRIAPAAQATSSTVGQVDFTVLRLSEPHGYNILTESNYLHNNAAFETSLGDPGFRIELMRAYYRALVDYWLVGYEGPHQNLHQSIFQRYWDNINAGRDPGVPFANGPTQYVHQWGDQSHWTQEFTDDNDINPHGIPNGSILQATAGDPAAAYYVPDPIWSQYISKNGPNVNGPGLPTGEVHSWNTGRGVRGSTFYYDKVQNYERGAITWNSTENTVFLPNCNAYNIQNSWATSYMMDMVKRFALSNEPYTNAGITPTDDTSATRAQLAQTLMFAEGYSYCNTCGDFSDTQNHWGRTWIRIAANQGIVTGYSDGTFRPNASATRGQFSKMVVLSRQFPLSTPSAPNTSSLCNAATGNGYNSFSDVCRNDVFYSYIETAKSRNIISGYSDGTFQPSNPVLRPQMIKMVDIALTSSGFPPPSSCWADMVDSVNH